MKKNLVLFLFLYFQDGFSCSFKNHTGQENFELRDSFFTKRKNSGLRVAWLGMKDKNTKHGLGGVNAAIEKFELGLCDHFESEKFKKKYPKVDVVINKLDFKGYYLTCSPEKNCLNIIDQSIRKLPKVLLKGDEAPFEIISAKASNYKEGYIKARAISAYKDYEIGKEPFHEFINKKMKEAIAEATGKSSFSEINSSDSLFMEKLSKNIEKYRKEGLSSVDEKFKKLVLGLDTFLEIPFVSSNDIEKELSEALNFKVSGNSKDYTLSSAKTVDDLFLVIKKDNKIEKVIGIDIRGLGILNISTRYSQLINSFQTKGDLKDMENIYKLSLDSIESADLRMEKSLDLYTDIIKKELKNSKGENLDQAISKSHQKYYEEVKKNKDLMLVRAGAVCQKNKRCIMDNITIIHNKLKLLEAAGIDWHFGKSCLGTEYWIRKLGLHK